MHSNKASISPSFEALENSTIQEAQFSEKQGECIWLR